MTLKERLAAPTPTFFKKVRNIGLILATVSATILTAPITLPAIVIKIAGYLGVGAAFGTAVSQAVTADKPSKKKNGK